MMRTTVTGSGTLHLGKQGENLTRVLVFPETAGWRNVLGPGRVQLLYLPPGGEAAFPVGLETEDGAAVWPVAAAETALAGYGRCELRWSAGERILKTRSYPTFVAAALSDGGEAGGAQPPSDHRVLAHRDAADQHPMAAITGLADAVRRIPPPVEPLTNLELEELLT